MYSTRGITYNFSQYVATGFVKVKRSNLVVFQKEAAHILTEQFRSDEVYMHLFTFVLVHNSNPSRQLFFWVAV